MRLNKSDLLAVLLIVFVGGLQVAATNANTVPTFTPGNYKLTKGDVNLCGGDNIHITDDGLDLAIEPHHYFSTSPRIDSIEEGPCKHKMEDKVKKYRNRTVLTFTDNVTCQEDYGVGYDKLVKKLVVREDRIYLLVEEDDGDGNSYDCSWMLD